MEIEEENVSPNNKRPKFTREMHPVGTHGERTAPRIPQVLGSAVTLRRVHDAARELGKQERWPCSCQHSERLFPLTALPGERGVGGVASSD